MPPKKKHPTDGEIVSVIRQGMAESPAGKEIRRLLAEPAPIRTSAHGEPDAEAYAASVDRAHAFMAAFGTLLDDVVDHARNEIDADEDDGASESQRAHRMGGRSEAFRMLRSESTQAISASPSMASGRPPSIPKQ